MGVERVNIKLKLIRLIKILIKLIKMLKLIKRSIRLKYKLNLLKNKSIKINLALITA